MNSEARAKVYVDLPHPPAIGGETFWADPVVKDLYRLANIPFWAYGLNYNDVVRAPPDADGIPVIQEVVKPSGHRTLRVMFDTSVDSERQSKLLDEIHRPRLVTFERANGQLVAINVAPCGDYLEVFDQLEAWAESGHLDFETCPPRMDGSFDDLPSE